MQTPMLDMSESNFPVNTQQSHLQKAVGIYCTTCARNFVTCKNLKDGWAKKGADRNLVEREMADALQDSDVSDRSSSLSQFSYAVYLYDPER
jgi:hypothetical protein